jgi:alginate O-acetyltransferase complex protein AlgJ
MRILPALLVFSVVGIIPVRADEQSFRSELAAHVAQLEKKNASATTGADGWLFLTNELRFLAQSRLWGDVAPGTARSAKSGDPLPAILDFHRQLREHGIELLLVPVPAKAAVYWDKLGLNVRTSPIEAGAPAHQFYDGLRARGVDVLDLTSVFAQNRDQPRGPLYCWTDSHWSGVGCMLAAQAIAERVRAKLDALPPKKDYATAWSEVTINGDLAGLLGADVAKPPAEKVAVRTVAEKANGAAIQPDVNSPILVLGDSHTLVFHEFHGERAGLVDQLAEELGFAPDLIGTRGSGATAVRISLYRRTRSDPSYLNKKKLIVWCFASREFTEADQGWVPQPIGK